MQKGELACDPRGMIYDAYRIDGIEDSACRTIFLDWALGVPGEEDSIEHIQTMLDHYGSKWPNHPMTEILKSGLTRSAAPKRRRNRRGQ